jgi:hypothetical protein
MTPSNELEPRSKSLSVPVAFDLPNLTLHARLTESPHTPSDSSAPTGSTVEVRRSGQVAYPIEIMCEAGMPSASSKPSTANATKGYARAATNNQKKARLQAAPPDHCL